jgi:DNA-binding transcriptional regulator GbsR (MarR family)
MLFEQRLRKLVLLQRRQADDARTQAEQQAWNRLQKAARAGETSEPVVDWNSKINQARNQEEVMQILDQARQEAQNI